MNEQIRMIPGDKLSGDLWMCLRITKNKKKIIIKKKRNKSVEIENIKFHLTKLQHK